MSSADGVNWGGKQTFAGGGLPQARSDDGPCLLAANNLLYLTWSGRGAQRRLQWTSTADGVNWTPKVMIPGERSEHSPSLAFFNGTFYIAWTGTDDQHHVNVMSSADGVNWGGKRTFREIVLPDPDDHRYEKPYAIVGLMWLWMEQDRIDPSVRSGWRRAIEEMKDRYNVDEWTLVLTILLPLPSLIISRIVEDLVESLRKPFDRYLTTIGLLRTIVYYGSTENWFNLALVRHTLHYALDKAMNVQARSDDGPCLLAANNLLYLTWSGRGAQRRLQWMSAGTASSWDAKIIIGERSEHSPSLAFFNGTFYIAWTGTDDQHHVNVMSSADGVNWGGKKTFTGDAHAQAENEDEPSHVNINKAHYLTPITPAAQMPPPR